MRILNCGGATAILEHQGRRMLCDPWLDDGIFHGAWYHYPPSPIKPEDIGHVDYVFISHIHEDHCSAGTLRHVNRDAEILIPDKTPNFVEKFLLAQRLGFRKITKIGVRRPTQIAPGLVADCIEADPENEMAYAIDSGLILNWDGFTIYNANDCYPHRAGIEYVNAHYKIDLALLPYSGGSGYPSCYLNLSDEQKAERARSIMHSRMNTFFDATRQLAPRYVMPFADQYVIAGSRAGLNRYISHPPCPGVVAEPYAKAGLSSELLLLNAGQAFDFDQQLASPAEPYRHYSAQDREIYVDENLRDKKYDHELFELNTSVHLGRLLKVARARLWQEQQRRKSFPDWRLYIEIPERQERYEIDLTTESVVDVAWGAELQEPYLKVGATPSLLALILIGHISINIADAALFLDYERRPDQYVPELYVLLNLLRC